MPGVKIGCSPFVCVKRIFMHKTKINIDKQRAKMYNNAKVRWEVPEIFKEGKR